MNERMSAETISRWARKRKRDAAEQARALQEGRLGKLAGLSRRRIPRRYFPGVRDSMVFFQGAWCTNLYSPPGLVAAAGDWSLYDRLTLYVAGNERSAQKVLLDWLAAPLQHLKNGEPLRMKSFHRFYRGDDEAVRLMCAVLFEIYGVSNCVTIDQHRSDAKTIRGLRNKLLVVLKEAPSDRKSFRSLAQSLKGIAGCDWLGGRAIGAKASSEPHIFNLVCVTTDRNAFARRLRGLNMVSHLVRDGYDPSLCASVEKDYRSGKAQLKAFLAHLESRPTTLSIGAAPDTNAREKLVCKIQALELAFWETVRRLGWMGVCRIWLDVQSGSESVEFPAVVRYREEHLVVSEVIERVFANWCRSRGEVPTQGIGLLQAMHKLLPEVKPARFRLGGPNPRRGWRGFPMAAGQ